MSERSGGLTPGDPLGDRPTAERPTADQDRPTAERPDRPTAERPTADQDRPTHEPPTAGQRPERERPTTERPPPSGTLWSGDRTDAPERPVPGYTSPAPPGAGGLGLPQTGPPISGRPALAGWWRRVGAQVIDGLIVSVGAALLFVAITAPFSVGFFAGDEVGVVAIIVGALLAILSVAVVALLYAPALMSRTNGKTLGRMATGIRVIRADGQPITFGFAMLREVAVKTLLVGIASTLTGGIAYLLDVLWPLWDEENRALHDFVVNTRTVMD